MQNVKKPLSLIETVALGYLYIPIIIFMLSWLKLWLSIPVALLVLFSLYKILFNKELAADSSRIKITPSLILFSAISFAIILIMSYLLGMGGFTEQPYDATKHNFILKDLIENHWPVRFEANGVKGVLCYYIAGYIVPALFGKMASSFEAASNFSVIWHAAGFLLAILLLYKTLANKNGKGKPSYILILLFVVLLFAPFNALMQFICIYLYPDQPIASVHWISDNINVSFVSNLTSLRYVYPQFVPTLIVTALLFRLRRNYKFWAFIVAPLIAFSVFSFIGMTGLMLIMFIWNLIKDKSVKTALRSIISIENISGVISAILFLLYLAGNIMQTKPESAKIGLSLVDYGQFPLVLLLQELSWGLWILFLFKTNKKEPVLYAASICLFILPFVEIGRFNDLCSRGSMSALICLSILVGRTLIDVLGRTQKRLLALTALIIALLLSGTFFWIAEIHLPESDKGIMTPEYNWWGIDSSIEFYTMNEWTRYQYVNWEENSLSNFILN